MTHDYKLAKRAHKLGYRYITRWPVPTIGTEHILDTKTVTGTFAAWMKSSASSVSKKLQNWKGEKHDEETWPNPTMDSRRFRPPPKLTAE